MEKKECITIMIPHRRKVEHRSSQFEVEQCHVDHQKNRFTEMKVFLEQVDFRWLQTVSVVEPSEYFLKPDGRGKPSNFSNNSDDLEWSQRRCFETAARIRIAVLKRKPSNSHFSGEFLNWRSDEFSVSSNQWSSQLMSWEVWRWEQENIGVRKAENSPKIKYLYTQYTSMYMRRWNKFSM